MLSMEVLIFIHSVQYANSMSCILDYFYRNLNEIGDKTFQSNNDYMNSHICKLVNKCELHIQGVNFVNFKLFVSIST